MKILYSEHNAPNYIRPPVLSPEQVICGPEYPDQSAEGRVISLKTVHGQYDIAEVIGRLPAEQKPELVVVRGDNTGQNVPRNLGALRCRKVLVVGDTHHRTAPLRRLLSYALIEPFDAVIFDYTRQHAHYFLEAGLSSVYWLPGFNVDRVTPPAQPERNIALSFVGSVGKRHPRRTKLLGALKRAGLPLQIFNGPATQSRMVHARSRVSLNSSLNGDLNLRVFEVLASRGALLTDRLMPESGFDLLLAEGEQVMTFGGVEDCIAQCRMLLEDRALAERIAIAGHERYEAILAPERIHEDFLAIVERGQVRPEFDLARDPRSRRPKADDLSRLMQRMGRYELVQELHRLMERTTILASARIDERLVTDLLDLPRLGLAIDGRAAPEREGALQRELTAAGMEGRCRWLSSEADVMASRWDILLATMADWRSGAAGEMLRRGGASLLFVTDLLNDATALAELQAGGLERVKPKLPLFTPARQKAA